MDESDYYSEGSSDDEYSFTEGDFNAENDRKAVSGKKRGPFGVLGLNDDLIFSLEKRLKFKQPSPIQRKVIPQALAYRDILCLARTGSGKTIAYLAPIVQLLKCHSTRVGSRCLIILPTRELSLQVSKVLRKLISNNSLKHACLIGGQGLESQFSVLSNNPDVIIATPGRLAQHIVENSLQLDRNEIFVLDEADKLCEEGFLPQIYKIVSHLPTNRQSMIVSATLPTQVAEFIKFNLKDPFLANVDKDHQLSEDLRVDFIYIRSGFKIPALIKIANTLKDNSTIVFTATRHHVEFLKLLFDILDLKASYVYGTMDMSLRVQQMAKFAKNKTNFLIVTDVAARGLDIPIVNNVINFDFPRSPKLFIHRAGRTARAGRTGCAVSLVTSQDLSFVCELEIFLGKKIEISKGELKSCLLGSIGNLDKETESFQLALSSNIELQRLEKSMNAGLNLYYKTRAAPSRSSVLKAKEFVENSGGLTEIENATHPSWSFVGVSPGSNDFLKALSNFRPEGKRDFKPVSINRAGSEPEGGDCHNNDIKDKHESPKGGPRISKRSRKKLEKGVELALKIKKRGKVNSLIASTNMDEKYERDVQMKLPDMTLNINPDTERDIQRNRYSQKMKWDPKRKKFTQTIVDNITKTYRNESGVKVKGEIECKGLLKKWMASTKIRLQKSGETEIERSNVGKKSRVKTDEEDQSAIDVLSEASNPKYAALVNAHREGQKLTHKEQRLLNKLIRKEGNSDKGDKLKSPLQMQKVKAKQTQASRRAKFKRKQEAKLLRQSAPSRSIMICGRR